VIYTVAVAISLFSSSSSATDKLCFGDFENVSFQNPLEDELGLSSATSDNMPACRAAMNAKLMLLIR